MSDEIMDESVDTSQRKKHPLRNQRPILKRTWIESYQTALPVSVGSLKSS